MKRSWLVDTTTVARSHAGVTGSPSSLSRSPYIIRSTSRIVIR